MVIDSNSINPAQPGKRNGGTDSAALDKLAEQSRSDNSNSAASTAGTVASDTVELSSQAQNLGRLQQALADQPEVDEARVAQLRQQVADGTYQVDANSIAVSILRSDQNF
ncbi:MAG: flagellar biosynthesis anti-sigma factor FlgM [Pseudomonadales bacterium]